MSAGTGITHSEFNPSAIEDLHFFQIWILPEKRNIKPRYDQKNFKNLFQKNEFIQLVGSEQSGEYLTINQDAYISRAIVDKEKEFVYTSKNSESSIFIFLIEGKIQNEDNVLKRRDSIGIINSRKNIFTSLEDSDVLVIEVPN
jgi:redox-sensitive bicupin YhaK (pirin superfamily)